MTTVDYVKVMDLIKVTPFNFAVPLAETDEMVFTMVNQDTGEAYEKWTISGPGAVTVTVNPDQTMALMFYDSTCNMVITPL